MAYRPKTNRANTRRALALLQFFEKRIRSDDFYVQKADWHEFNEGTAVTLTIDVYVENVTLTDKLLDV